MEPLIYLNNPEKYTLALGLRNMTQVQTDSPEVFTPMMAAMVMSILPTLTVFFAGQKYFVRGLSLTGMREG
jgi:multiple sugar transport system permease protein